MPSMVSAVTTLIRASASAASLLAPIVSTSCEIKIMGKRSLITIAL